MISAGSILSFIDRLERENVCLHGFELREHGEVRAEGYYAPFKKGEPHRVYSVSKTMVSLAVGILADEGKLSLDDHIVDYFPDKLPEKPDERLLRLTIRDMLRMATCYKRTTYREGIDYCWSDSFFTTKPDHEPGALFNYDTSCSQVLGEMCQRVSGRPLLEFLTERVFEPVGATGEKRWQTDPSGIPTGGSGLIMSLCDMAKVAQCVMDGGRGILPAWYVQEATSCKIATFERPLPEEKYGYGYKIWQTRNGWAMFGMGGQMAIACPKEGILLCTIADTRLDPQGVQRLHDAFHDEIVAHQGEAGTAEDEAALAAKLASLTCAAVPHVPGDWNTAPRAYAMEENAFGLARVEMENGCVRMIWQDVEHAFSWAAFGEGCKGVYPGTDIPCLTSAGLTAQGALRVRCQLIGDSPCGLEITLSEVNETLSVRMMKLSDPMTNRYDGIVWGKKA